MNVTCAEGNVDELFDDPAFAGLLEEYDSECAIKALPHTKPSRERYVRLESTGVLNVVTVRHGRLLVGFYTILHTVMPHYELPFTIVESIFLSKKYRKGTAGLRVIKDIERRTHGEGLFCSAPIGSQFEGVLRGRGYLNTSSIFFKPRCAFDDKRPSRRGIPHGGHRPRPAQ